MTGLVAINLMNWLVGCCPRAPLRVPPWLTFATSAGEISPSTSIVDGRMSGNPWDPGDMDGRPTVKPVLASRGLDSGAILREGDTALTDWPGNVPVPAGASSHMQDLVGPA